MNTFRTTEDCRNCCKREPQMVAADWWEVACACACTFLLLSLGAVLVTHNVWLALPSLVFGFIAMCGSHKAQEDRA